MLLHNCNCNISFVDIRALLNNLSVDIVHSLLTPFLILQVFKSHDLEKKNDKKQSINGAVLFILYLCFIQLYK